ncbi:MAG: DUF1015 domain-containing protein [Anaerolineae bacterium]|nr:DUF1015 domain-containing protein [Anaerolineae bacterium]MDW8100586.1 DUF1015 domain-containing protein [Anaerolineae bacterium]
MLAPFRGWRFAVPATENLISRLSPPYDVISAEQRQALMRLHPHNIVQIDLPDETMGLERYTRAAERFRQWQREGILIQEAAPALYVLEQCFRLPGGPQLTRTGLIGRLRLVPWGEGVLPHERTFPHAKADRLALLMATRAEFNPVFLLYSDPLGEVLAPLLAARPATPSAVAEEPEITHRLWVITDVEAIAQACAAMAERILYVADGHHRYETALAYQRQEMGEDGDSSEAPYNYVLIYAVAMEDPGLTILPTHRCLHDVPGFDPDRLLRELERHFELIHFAVEADLLTEMGRATRAHRVLGLVLADRPGGYLLRLRSNAATLSLLFAQDHPAVADWDVTALQTLVLGPILGIGRESHEQYPFIDFEPDAQRALAGVRHGRYQAVFLVTPPRLSQLRAVAEAGQVAPPKATFFYPKLPSGLVIYDLEHP